MKNLLKTLSVAALFAVAIVSCDTDPCKKVDCGPNGACVEGNCNCNLGYELDADGKCNQEMRAKFISAYSVSGTITCGVTGSGTIPPATNLTIAASSTAINKVAITIFGTNIFATVNGTSLTVDNQTISGFTYTGTGSISGNTLNITLNEDDPSVPEVCVYTISGNKI